mmetsp:Transcript_11819/g.18201  ORF Transcript_11819/g.18201 Transcript_11819/m.18201 type:complete len:109 (-) Transcript_11819:1049-1375(-)
MAAANAKINEPDSKLSALAKFLDNGRLIREADEEGIHRNLSCMNVNVGAASNKGHGAINDFLLSQNDQSNKITRPPGRRKGSAMEDHPRSHEGFAHRKKTFVIKDPES